MNGLIALEVCVEASDLLMQISQILDAVDLLPDQVVIQKAGSLFEMKNNILLLSIKADTFMEKITFKHIHEDRCLCEGANVYRRACFCRDTRSHSQDQLNICVVRGVFYSNLFRC